MTEEKTISIGDVRGLLEQGYKVEVDSPDGWVGVSDFVDKGTWTEYVLKCNGKKIVCNENHLFETTTGWFSAKEILRLQERTGHKLHYLCEDGKFHSGEVVCNDWKQVPIVDIQVDHKNHRYFTDGVSSHNTGVGKSLAMCHLASAALSESKNVLYITMEMAEERIAERIDANLLDVPIDQLENMGANKFQDKISKLSNRCNGKLIVKEYPTAAAHVGHFRALLLELKMKKQFAPDVIFIDYLNICASSRIKGLSGGVNTYSLIKAIAEEIRGLAVEFGVPIWSATQVTRTGFANSDIDLTDTSESFGLPATADLMIALISTEELEAAGQVMVKQLKNRYCDVNKNKRFCLGIDRSKMRLYDIADPQGGLSQTSSSATPPVAQTPFSEALGKAKNLSFNDLKT